MRAAPFVREPLFAGVRRELEAAPQRWAHALEVADARANTLVFREPPRAAGALPLSLTCDVGGIGPFTYDQKYQSSV